MVHVPLFDMRASRWEIGRPAMKLLISNHIRWYPGVSTGVRPAEIYLGAHQAARKNPRCHAASVFLLPRLKNLSIDHQTSQSQPQTMPRAPKHRVHPYASPSLLRKPRPIFR